MRFWLLQLALMLAGCAAAPEPGAAERVERPVPDDVAMLQGPFDTPEDAALAAAGQAYPDRQLEAALLLLLADDTQSRVEVRGADEPCLVYSPVDGVDGWYAGGDGTPCDVIEVD